MLCAIVSRPLIVADRAIECDVYMACLEALEAVMYAPDMACLDVML